MKWIGQHIWDFISRFRSDVYIDDDASLNVKTIKSETTINLTLPDVSYVNFLNRSQYFGHIGSDSGSKLTEFVLYESITSPQDTFGIYVLEHGNTKIRTYDAAGTAAHFEIEADGNITLDAEGDIILEAAGNDITMDTDNLHLTSSTQYYPQLILEGTETTTGTGPSIRLKKNGADSVNGEVLGNLQFIGDASNGSEQSFANIVGSIEDVDYGNECGQINIQVAHEGTLRDAFVAAAVKDATSGEANQVNVTIANAVGSTTTVAGDLTVSGGDITLSGTGRIQGVDTVSASTDAANKSYVDGKYMYSYIQIHGRTQNDNTVWNFPDASADGEFNWHEATSHDAWDGADSGVTNDGDNTTAGTTVISLAREIGVMGIVLPYDCTLVGFTGIGRDLTGNNPFKAGLWTSQEFSTYGGNANDTNYTLRAVATASYSGGGGSSYNGICKLEDLTANHTLPAGQILLPSLSESTSSRSYVSMTIVLKVPIITV